VKVLVERSAVPHLGKWHWDIKRNGYYNAGWSRWKILAHLTAWWFAVLYFSRRFLALQLKKAFLRVSRGVLSSVEMLYRF
jgi:hypothetical protein